MITVYSVQPHLSTPGLFRRCVDSQTFGLLDTVEDYVNHVREECPGLLLFAEGDAGYERVKEADGKIDGQGNGKVIGWRDCGGRVLLELVCVE